MRFLCSRVVMLILTWSIYYLHRAQRLPWHFTKGDEYCGMGAERTTAAQGAHRDWLWSRAPTQGGVGKLEQHLRGVSAGQSMQRQTPNHLAHRFCLQIFSPRVASMCLEMRPCRISEKGAGSYTASENCLQQH